MSTRSTTCLAARRIARAAVSSFVLAAAGATALLAGCRAVYTKAPIVAKSDPALAAAAEGVWLCSEDGEPLLIKMRADGSIFGAGATWDAKTETFTFETWMGIVASTDAGVLLSVQERGEKSDGWRLLLLEGLKPSGNFRADGIVLASEPSVEWFTKAVQRGALAGRVSDGGSVFLEGDTASITKAISEAMRDQSAPFDRPVVVARRVSRPNWAPN